MIAPNAVICEQSEQISWGQPWVSMKTFFCTVLLIIYRPVLKRGLAPFFIGIKIANFCFCHIFPFLCIILSTTNAQNN